MDGWGRGWARAEHRIHSLGPPAATPDEGEAGMPTTRRPAQGRRLGAGPWAGAAVGRAPFSGSRRLVVTFGSFVLHGPPPQEEGGKHRGPEARPEVKGCWGGGSPPRQRRPAAGTGSQHQQPFLRWWWAAGAGGSVPAPRPPLPSDAESVHQPSLPRLRGRGPRSPRLRQGTQAGSAVAAGPPGTGRAPVRYATWCRKRPPAGRAVGAREGPAPRVPGACRAGAGT